MSTVSDQAVNPEAQSPPLAEDLQAEALFKAARRRRFRRRSATVAVGLLLVTAIALFVTTRGPSGPDLPTSLTAASFASSVVPATLSAGTAAFSFTEENRKVPYPSCSRVYDSVVTSGGGQINLSKSVVSYTAESRGCYTHTLSFCSTPVPTIRTATAMYQYIPHQGTSCSSGLTSGGKRRVVITPGPLSSRPWIKSSTTLEGGGANSDPGIRGPLVSWSPLSVINALRGRMTRAGVSDIHGASATEYLGTATLASVHAVTGFDPVLTAAQGTLQPSANRISIGVKVWVDPHDRVLQISTTEPTFTGVQRSGADEEGFSQIFSTEFANGGRLVQQGYSLTTVDFYNFGTPAKTAIPAPSKVSALFGIDNSSQAPRPATSGS